jgi:ribosomal protein L12E/L44/L45/RPP1/RPP2
MSDQVAVIGGLQKLVQLIGGTLPMYLVNAAPWIQPGQARAEQVLRLVVQDQEQTLKRLAELIVDLGGVAESAWFPASYTSLNDVSLDYLLCRLTQEQQALVPAIEAIAEQLPEGSAARDLAEEAAGAARGHAISFEEMTQHASSSC